MSLMAWRKKKPLRMLFSDWEETMIRRAAILMLMAAFSLTTTPSFACTGISLKAKDGAAIRGRTLEFGFPLQSNVLVVPAGIAGANGLGAMAIIDGLNDQGLSIGLFYFPDYAHYADASQADASRALAPQDFGMWVLGNFATVDEVKSALADVVMVPTPFPGLGSADGMAADVHFFIQDKTGKSIAVEPSGGKLKVTDAPLGVMTNAPTYDWHITNLDNYINLSVKDVESGAIGDVKLEAIGSGSSLLGLPGDFTPPSRFVRTAIFSQAAVPNDTAGDAVLAAFHILNQFDIPEGSVQSSAVGGTLYETT